MSNFTSKYPTLKSGELFLYEKNLDFKSVSLIKNYQKEFVAWLGKSPAILFKTGKSKEEVEVEVFVSAFARLVGQKCVKALPAVIDFKGANLTNKIKYFENDDLSLINRMKNPTRIAGVMSEDYVADRGKTKTFDVSVLTSLAGYKNDDGESNLFYEDIISGVELYAKSMSKDNKKVHYNLKEISDDLIKIMIIDYLFLQQDRGAINIEMSLTDLGADQYKLEVSPLFDNASCCKINSRVYEGWNTNLYQLNDNALNFQLKLRQSFKDSFASHNYRFMFKDAYVKESRLVSNDINLTLMSKMVNKNKSISDYLYSVMQVDFIDVINQIQIDMPFYELSEKTQQVIKFVFDSQKQMINGRVKEINQNTHKEIEYSK